MADSQSETVNDVPQEETALSLIEGVSARLDSTIRFCVVMGDRLSNQGEASIFYTFLNVLEPIRDTVSQAVQQLYRSKSNIDPMPGIDPSEMKAMARRAWQERGIVILWPERIKDQKDRQRVLEVARTAYGKREGGVR